MNLFSGKIFLFLLFCLTFSLTITETRGDDEIVFLNYISPADLIEALALENQTPAGYLLSLNDSRVSLRFNLSNNQILLKTEPL